MLKIALFVAVAVVMVEAYPGGHGYAHGHANSNIDHGHGGGGGGGGYGHGKKHSGPPRPYHFSYGINDPHHKGPNFGQEEHSDGKVVKGSYKVDLPDGRTQLVHYTADHHNGYQAHVSYIGKARFPGPAPKKHHGHY